MVQPDEPTGVVPERSDSGGRWALLAAVVVTSIGMAFLNFFQLTGNASDAGVLTATPAGTTASISEGTADRTWAPLSGVDPGQVAALIAEGVTSADIPDATQGDTPSVAITPSPKAKVVDTTTAIGWPLPSRFASSSFGLRTDPLTRTVRFHTGTDFPAPCGLPVYAALDGTVTGSGEAGAYGNRVVIDHGQRFGGPFITTYSHLQYIRTFEGAVVKRGDVVGLVGTTGRSTGCHLHFETIIGHLLVDAIPLLLGEGPSSEQWPVGYFMPYGTSVTVRGTPSPTAASESPLPSASSESPLPSASSESPLPTASSEPPLPSASSEPPLPSASSEPPLPTASSDSPLPSASSTTPVPPTPPATTPVSTPASSDPGAGEPTPPVSTPPPESTPPPSVSEPAPDSAPAATSPATSEPPAPSEPPASSDPPASAGQPERAAPSGESATN